MILSRVRQMALFAAALPGLCGTAWAAPPVPTGEAAFFVDAAKGDDSNSGKSADKPLKTLRAAQKLMDKVPADMRVILNLARGSVWREDLGLPTRREYISQVCWRNGRPLLTIRPYGEGDKPTVSGLDPLPNQAFRRHDAAAFPNVWSQRVTPPTTYTRDFQGVIVAGNRPLREASLLKVYPGTGNKSTGPGFVHHETEADALRFVNGSPGSFYARDNQDGSYDYFVHSGSDPTQDGLIYEYKVRHLFCYGKPWNRWEDLRLIGLNERNGLGTHETMTMKGVEVLYGCTHNMLAPGYRFENVLSVGYWGSTAFHAHDGPGPDFVYGSLYDRCTARDTYIAFYDHCRKRRPWVYLRDCVTENANSILAHGDSTLKSYVIGHRHNPAPGKDPTRLWAGRLSYLTAGENYVEDCLFRFGGSDATWHHLRCAPENTVMHGRFRNSVFYSVPVVLPPINLTASGPTDIEYDYCMLILDFRGQAIAKTPPGRVLSGVGAGVKGKMTFRNSIIAVVNAPDMMRQAGGPGVAMLLPKPNQDFCFVFDNCVLTYIGNLDESAGKPGKDYVFLAPEDIFSGDVSRGDYNIKPSSEAEKRNVGYRPGRKPVYRPIADKLAAELPD